MIIDGFDIKTDSSHKYEVALSYKDGDYNHVRVDYMTMFDIAVYIRAMSREMDPGVEWYLTISDAAPVFSFRKRMEALVNAT